ncbi:hypothetical protein LBMAG42_13560 [Deltaproteobacteria bacterium]|nr:hypothetical protein LBMAG42_13560 [Deltaproteobacteria bacterium]
MALILDPGVLERLHAHATEGYPFEVVGLLAGSRAEHRVTRIVPLVNERADSPRNRYSVNGLVVLRAEEALIAEGFDVLGTYHSHPDHPSRWSDFDRDHALPNLSYIIVSVSNGHVATTQSWRLREDRSQMDEEPIQVEPPMSVNIQIPSALRSFTDGQAAVSVAGETAGAALLALTTSFPGLARHLRGEDGQLRSFVNVYKNDEDIRFLGRDATPLVDGDTLIIVPSIAGGAA